MVFSSVVFLFYFLPLFLVLFNFTPPILKKYILLTASLVFYAWGAPIFIITVLVSCLIDYVIINQFQKKIKKLLLLFSLVLNIGLLLYFKYANFFVENFNSLLDTPIKWTEIALPIGISFFTFQKISYLLDIYWEKEKKLDRFTDYLLYILLFPQLIAGPIVRFNDINNQLINYNGKITVQEKYDGIIRFIVGLGKKVLIANTMGLLVVKLKEIGIDQLDTYHAWLLAIAYSFQLYFDFSGYSDMAIGLGKIMGFRFPENFNFPYLSRSITNFWQRWHITLGNWMREYLYIPLGGNRVSKPRMYFNLFLVFLISGFWHGAAWGFIIWGAYHGIFLVLERLFLGKILQKLPSFISVFFTFILVTIGWLFFSNDWDTAIKLLDKMLVFSYSPDINFEIQNKILFFLAIAILLSFVGIVKFDEIRLAYINKSFILSFLVTCVMIVIFVWSLLNIVAEGFNPFIYYRF